MTKGTNVSGSQVVQSSQPTKIANQSSTTQSTKAANFSTISGQAVYVPPPQPVTKTSSSTSYVPASNPFAATPTTSTNAVTSNATVSNLSTTAQISGMAIPAAAEAILTNANVISALSGVASGVLGAVTGTGTGKRGTPVAVGRKYILYKRSDGSIYAVSRVPRRRYAPRSRGTQLDKLMQMALISSMMGRRE